MVNNPGLLSAKAFEKNSSASSIRISRRHVLISVEPDGVEIQPLPLETKQPLVNSVSKPSLSGKTSSSSKPETSTTGGS